MTTEYVILRKGGLVKIFKIFRILYKGALPSFEDLRFGLGIHKNRWNMNG